MINEKTGHKSNKNTTVNTTKIILVVSWHFSSPVITC